MEWNTHFYAHVNGCHLGTFFPQAQSFLMIFGVKMQILGNLAIWEKFDYLAFFELIWRHNGNDKLTTFLEGKRASLFYFIRR